MEGRYDNVLFRASGTGQIMTEPRSKSELLSETTKKYLVGVMINEKYGRRADLTNKFIQKGLMVEEDSITLYSRVKKEFYQKNEIHLSNDFLKGTPDLFEGSDILRAKKIIDIKSSFDIFTFFNAKMDTTNKNYYWQLQSYMDLTGAETAELAYCLVDTPDTIIEGLKRKFMWDAGVKGDDEFNHPALAMIEKLAKYSDIDIQDRMFTIEIQRNQDDIERLHEQVKACRQWMNENL